MTKGTLMKGTIYMSAASLIFMLSGYLVNIWLGRFLGPEDYGAFGVVLTLWSTVNLFINTGLPQAVSKYAAMNPDDAEGILKTGIKSQLSLGLATTILYWLSADLLASLFKDSSLAGQIRLSALIFIPYGLYALYFGYYNGLHRFAKQSSVNITYSVFKLAGAYLLVKWMHLNGVYVGYALAPLAAVLIGLKIPKNKAPQFPLKTLIRFSMPITLITVITTLQQAVDLFAIKAILSSSTQAGYYTAIQNIAYIPYYALGAVAVVIFPSLSREIGKKDILKAKEIINQAVRMTAIVVIPMVVMIAMTSSYIIRLVYSDKYILAAPTLSVLAIGYGFLTGARILNSILAGDHQLKSSVISSIMGLAVSVFLCIVLVPRIGIMGGAIATTLSALVTLLSSAFFVYKRFQQLVPWENGIRIALSAAALVLATVGFYKFFPMNLISYPVMGILYLGFLILSGELNKADLGQIREMLPKKQTRG